MKVQERNEVIAWMRDLGIVSATIGGETFTLGPVPIVAPKPAPTKTPKRCECGHPLSRHRNGECVNRLRDGSPCRNKCRIIEAGET